MISLALFLEASKYNPPAQNSIIVPLPADPVTTALPALKHSETEKAPFKAIDPQLQPELQIEVISYEQHVSLHKRIIECDHTIPLRGLSRLRCRGWGW